MIDLLSIKNNYDPNVNEVVIDAEQFRRLFINLYENSIDALNANGKIEISTQLDFKTNIFLDLTSTAESVQKRAAGVRTVYVGCGACAIFRGVQRRVESFLML